MGFNIVTVNVSQTIGAIPSNLQQMSAGYLVWFHDS